jgi:SAM-dependent methyltransferase
MPETTITLNLTQRLFIAWNAERLGIDLQASIDRFARSYFHMPHGEQAFRDLITHAHEVLSVFYGDGPGEIYAAHQMHQHLHLLRWMSYKTGALPIALADGKQQATILDYGCGTAMISINTAIDWRTQGVTVRLVLADIHTVITDFLVYACRALGIELQTVDLPAESLPGCDIAIATEVWEHLYNPVAALEQVDTAIRPGGYLLTDVSDRQAEMFHVTPDLSALRERFGQMSYTQAGDYLWRKHA